MGRCIKKREFWRDTLPPCDLPVNAPDFVVQRVNVWLTYYHAFQFTNLVAVTSLKDDDKLRRQNQLFVSDLFALCASSRPTSFHQLR